MAKWKDPSDIVQKQVDNTINAIPHWKKGVESVEVSPTALAAKQKDKMLRNLTAKINDGTWESSLNNVSKETWVKKTVEKGEATMAIGVNNAAAKIYAFHRDFQEHLTKTRAKIAAMPTDTVQQKVAKMAAQMDANMAYKHKKVYD